MKRMLFLVLLSAGLTTAYSLLHKTAGMTLLYLVLQDAVYIVNLVFSESGSPHENRMGCLLTLLNGIAAVFGWIGWLHPIMHFVMTLASGYTMIEFTRKPGERIHSFYAEKRRQRREKS